MAFNLTGKRVVITGGTAGIGYAVAKRFIREGASVVISGRRQEGGNIADEIGAIFIQTDLNVESEVRSLFSLAEQSLGGIDVVINNAGVAKETGSIEETELKDYDFQFGLNMRGAYSVIKYAIAYLSEGASIINTASVSGMQGSSRESVYNATKAALINLTQSAALELAPRNIRVNTVSPGPIKTDMWPDEHPALPLMDLMVPLGRIGLPEEVAAAFHFLASDDSSFITGHNLVVDGGYTTGYSQQLINRVMS